ncbi:hypothetical protein Bca4012_100127 [Brassica carinata]
MNRPPENDLCSICHSHFTAPCQANCSHWFCGNCIMLVWRHGSTSQPCSCPLCRRPISLLVPTEETVDRIVLRDLESYNRLFGRGTASLLQMMQDLPFLLRRLLRELMDSQRTIPRVTRARLYMAMIVSAVYVISPVDIIPEGVVGVVGLLDDVFIALICFLHIAALYRSVLYRRHTGP